MDSIFNLKFPQKLYKIVSECKTGSIKWNENGTGIVIIISAFQKEYLSNTGYFKTGLLTSFIRSLNIYGFQKVKLHTKSYPRGYNEYRNDYFRKDCPHLLRFIKRKCGSSRIHRSNSSKKKRKDSRRKTYVKGNSYWDTIFYSIKTDKIKKEIKEEPDCKDNYQNDDLKIQRSKSSEVSVVKKEPNLTYTSCQQRQKRYVNETKVKNYEKTIERTVTKDTTYFNNLSFATTKYFNNRLQDTRNENHACKFWRNVYAEKHLNISKISKAKSTQNYLNFEKCQSHKKGDEDILGIKEGDIIENESNSGEDKNDNEKVTDDKENTNDASKAVNEIRSQPPENAEKGKMFAGNKEFEDAWLSWEACKADNDINDNTTINVLMSSAKAMLHDLNDPNLYNWNGSVDEKEPTDENQNCFTALMSNEQPSDIFSPLSIAISHDDYFEALVEDL